MDKDILRLARLLLRAALLVLGKPCPSLIFTQISPISTLFLCTPFTSGYGLCHYKFANTRTHLPSSSTFLAGASTYYKVFEIPLRFSSKSYKHDGDELRFLILCFVNIKLIILG